MRTAAPLAALAALAAVLAGCGGEGPSEGLTAAEIERLATPAPVVEVDRTVTLQPLAHGEAAAVPAVECMLGSEGKVVLAAGGGAATVRIGGRALTLEARGPVGPTGGYFEAGGLAVSIGRTAAGGAGGASALVLVTHRATGGTREFDATWRCG